MPNRMEEAKTACLMLGMADRLGVSPGSALAAGRLTEESLGEMVARCRQCAKSDECILWMVENADGAGEAPGYCLNSEELGQLARETG